MGDSKHENDKEVTTMALASMMAYAGRMRRKLFHNSNNSSSYWGQQRGNSSSYRRQLKKLQRQLCSRSWNSRC